MIRTLLTSRTSPRTSTRGFTLIELLVVIAIIGVLSSVVLASLNTARGKARDAKRLADLKQVQVALELYYDTTNTYPSSNAWWGTCSGWGSHATTGASGWVPNLAPTYISILPTDPQPVGTGNCYIYYSNGADYMLLAYGTVETYSSANNKWKRPSYPTEADFSFYTPGASTW